MPRSGCGAHKFGAFLRCSYFGFKARVEIVDDVTKAAPGLKIHFASPSGPQGSSRFSAPAAWGPAAARHGGALRHCSLPMQATNGTGIAVPRPNTRNGALRGTGRVSAPGGRLAARPARRRGLGHAGHVLSITIASPLHEW